MARGRITTPGFAHVGGTLNNIDDLPGLHDKSRPRLDSWDAAEREAARMGPARHGAEHGDNLSGNDSMPSTPRFEQANSHDERDSMPTTVLGRRRRRRTWESPASFEHHDAYDLTPDAAIGASARSGRQHRVICSFRINEGNRFLRQALMSCICTFGESYEWFRRLGLPVNSLKNKLPYHRDAMRNIKVVVTSPRLQRLIEASRTGDLFAEDILERPRPVFRTAAPGVGTVAACNLALIWVLLTARV